MELTISGADKGRVTIATGPEAREYLSADWSNLAAISGCVCLEIGGLIGEGEWTWLTPSQARELSAALEEAATLAAEEEV